MRLAWLPRRTRYMSAEHRDQLRGADANAIAARSFIDEMDSSCDSIGIDVPESLLAKA